MRQLEATWTSAGDTPDNRQMKTLDGLMRCSDNIRKLNGSGHHANVERMELGWGEFVS